MIEAKLEHINVTVTDTQATAALLVELFDWRIRWQGDSIHNGYSVHVGGDNSYLALYSPQKTNGLAIDNYNTPLGLNHIAIVVVDLDDIEKKVIAAGFKPNSHADYEPGRRFYFEDSDGLEIEVVSYTAN